MLKLKDLISDWNEKHNGTKRWTKKFHHNPSSGLTEFEKQGGKDVVGEGPSYQYAKEYMKVEKTYKAFWDAVAKLGKYNTKVTGDKTDEKIFIKQYNKQVIPFYKLMKSWIRGKQ